MAEWGGCLIYLDIFLLQKADRESKRKALRTVESLRHKLQEEEIDSFFAFDEAREALREVGEALLEAEEALREEEALTEGGGGGSSEGGGSS